MDKFVTVIKPSAKSLNGGKQDTKKQRSELRYKPYGDNKASEQLAEDLTEKERVKRFMAPLIEGGAKPSPSAIRKHLLNNLSDECNPITHSDIYNRTEHITSMVTGHQRGEGRANQKSYLTSRSKKLEDQLPERNTNAEAKVLSGVRVYIDGYLNISTDIEMKRIITLAGGEILHTASRATHILTSQQLSGSKTQKILISKSKSKVHVVRPQWITESIDAGKRLPERKYAAIKDATTKNLVNMLEAGSSR